MRNHCRRKCPKQVGRIEERCIWGFSDGGKQWETRKLACGWGIVWSDGRKVYELEEGGVYMGMQGSSFTAEAVGLGHLSERIDWWMQHGNEGRDGDKDEEEDGRRRRWETFRKKDMRREEKIKQKEKTKRRKRKGREEGGRRKKKARAETGGEGRGTMR